METPRRRCRLLQSMNACRFEERSCLIMNVNDIATLVSSIGFPIVMCGAMAWYVKYMSDQYKADLKALSAVIADNTKVIEGLRQLIMDKIASSSIDR